MESSSCRPLSLSLPLAVFKLIFKREGISVVETWMLYLLCVRTQPPIMNRQTVRRTEFIAARNGVAVPDVNWICSELMPELEHRDRILLDLGRRTGIYVSMHASVCFAGRFH